MIYHLIIFKINLVHLSFGITSVLLSEVHKTLTNTFLEKKIFVCKKLKLISILL